jgi:hypothetical protein
MRRERAKAKTITAPSAAIARLATAIIERRFARFEKFGLGAPDLPTPRFMREAARARIGRTTRQPTQRPAALRAENPEQTRPAYAEQIATPWLARGDARPAVYGGGDTRGRPAAAVLNRIRRTGKWEYQVTFIGRASGLLSASAEAPG